MYQPSISKILSWEAAEKVVGTWHEEGSSVVFTNGCFDLIHLGHVDYLEKARLIGDYLVVGLNTDSSVSRLKGSSRPVQDQEARARIMAGFGFVDVVVLFDEDTPQNLIETIKPNVLIKGNDYNISDIVGADFVLAHGGKVETIELVKGYSTSNIVEKIKKDSTF